MGRVIVLLVFFVFLGDGMRLPMHRRIHGSVRTRDLPPLTGGESVGSYYVDILVGKPPQLLRLDPDTGSGDLVVATPQCGCSHYGEGYVASRSTSALRSQCGSGCPDKQETTYLEACERCCIGTRCGAGGVGCGVCSINISYVDGSSAVGDIYQDLFLLDGATRPIFLGAMSNTGGKFSNYRNDGVLGLATKGVSLGVPSFMHQLVLGGLENTFSVCYGSYDGGQLFLGTFDPHYVAPQSNASFSSVTVSMDVSSGLYAVAPIAFAMPDGKRYDLGNASALLDTGSSLLVTKDGVFPPLLLSWIRSAAVTLLSSDALALLDQMISQPGMFQCFTAAQMASFLPCIPPLEVIFKDDRDVERTVPIPMSSVFWILESASFCPGSGMYSVAIGVIQGETGGFDFVFGDVFLRNLYTEFDRSRSLVTFHPPHSQLCGRALQGVSDTNVCIEPAATLFGLPLALGVAIICVSVACVAIVSILIIYCCCCRRSNGAIKYSPVPLK